VTVGDKDLALDPEAFKNFKARLMNKTEGEPVFAVGEGALSYDDMQTDLNKAALDKVDEVYLNNLIAVTGNSKTMFGIEQSGLLGIQPKCNAISLSQTTPPGVAAHR
jgi:hypothetical protein